MLHIKINWKARCPKHPKYNPEKDGEAGLKGGCDKCFALLDAHMASKKFLAVLDAVRLIQYDIGTKLASSPERE